MPGKLQPSPITASAQWALPLGVGLQVLLPPSSAGEGARYWGMPGMTWGDGKEMLLPREQSGKRGRSPQLHNGQRKRRSPLQLSGSKGKRHFQDCIDSVNAALAQLIRSVAHSCPKKFCSPFACFGGTEEPR